MHKCDEPLHTLVLNSWHCICPCSSDFIVQNVTPQSLHHVFKLSWMYSVMPFWAGHMIQGVSTLTPPYLHSHDHLSPCTNRRCGFVNYTSWPHMGRHHTALLGSRTLKHVFDNDGTKPALKDAVIVSNIFRSCYIMSFCCPSFVSLWLLI
jgi:hypothetical protein